MSIAILWLRDEDDESAGPRMEINESGNSAEAITTSMSILSKEEGKLYLKSFLSGA